MKNNDSEYLDWLTDSNQTLSKLYKPITTETTRKLATQLLLFSILLLAISFDIFQIKNINITGYTIEILNNNKILLYGGITICCYLLFLYVTDLYSDWNSNRDLSFLKLNVALFQEAELRGQELQELNNLILLSNSLIQNRKNKYKELDEFVKNHQKETDMLIEKVNNNDEIRDLFEIIRLSKQRYQELKEKRELIYGEIKNDGLDEIQSKIENFNKKSFLNEKLKFVTITLTRHKRLKQIRFIFEVIIPVAFCIVSIYFGIKTVTR